MMELDAFVVGVDGGGSKTQLTLFQSRTDGLSAVADSVGNSSNATVEDFANIAADLECQLVHLCEAQKIQIEQVTALGLGMAGAGRASVSDAWHDWACHRFSGMRVWVGSDLDLVLGNVQDGVTTLAMVAGTGTIAAMRDASGAIHRIGGWGPILGDEGGGYWMAIQAFQAVCKAMDRGDTPSPLWREAQVFLKVESWREAPAAIRLLTRSKISAFAEIVIRCSQEGDSEAQRIVQLTLSHWLGMLKALGARVPNGPIHLRLAGGLIVGSNDLRAQLLNNLTQVLSWPEFTVEVFEGATKVAAMNAIEQGSQQDG